MLIVSVPMFINVAREQVQPGLSFPSKAFSQLHLESWATDLYLSHMSAIELLTGCSELFAVTCFGFVYVTVSMHLNISVVRYKQDV